MIILLVAVFVLGCTAFAFEHGLGMNKAGPVQRGFIPLGARS